MRTKIVIKLLFVFATIGILSCQKQDDRYIDDASPNQRVTQFMDELRAKLIDSKEGWIGYLYTNLKSGYTFYFDFVDVNRVKMYADFNGTTLSEYKESSYSLRNTWVPSLIFDTYNHIHILSDPDVKISGGTRGEGLYADFEFSVQHVYEDSIILRGNLNGNKMVMMKATSEEANAFKNQTFVGLTDKVQDYVISNPFLYISDEGSNTPTSFTFNFSDRSVTFSYKENDELLEEKIALAAGKNTMWLKESFSHAGKNVRAIKFIDDEKLVAISDEGEEYNVRVGNNPIETLGERLFSQRYNFIQLLKDNQVGKFAELYDRVYQNVLNTGRTINHIELRVKDTDTITMNYQYTSSKDFKAFKDYQLVVEGNTAKFKKLPPGGSSGSYSNYNAFVPLVTELDEFLLENTFELDYYTGVINGAIQTLPRFKSQAEPEAFILLKFD